MFCDISALDSEQGAPPLLWRRDWEGPGASMELEQSALAALGPGKEGWSVTWMCPMALG